jgi:regulator of sirC expression with transglutaminase-like and TPR domain
MQTLQFQVQDDVYQDIMDRGIDIQSRFKEFLYDLRDDGFPAISTEEAKKRVSDAVERYENGTGTYLNEEESEQRINQFLDNLDKKYANH